MKYRIQNSSPQVPIHNQMNPVHNVPCNIWRFTLIVSSCLLVSLLQVLSLKPWKSLSFSSSMLHAALIIIMPILMLWNTHILVFDVCMFEPTNLPKWRTLTELGKNVLPLQATPPSHFFIFSSLIPTQLVCACQWEGHLNNLIQAIMFSAVMRLQKRGIRLIFVYNIS